MNTELRERAIFPVLIPLLAIVLTEIIVFAMSRVLLAADKDQAVIIALGTAIAILIGASFVAARPRIKTRPLVGFLAVLLVAAVAAGAFALQRGPSYLKEQAANRPKVDVSAKDLAFSVKTIDLATTGTIINFANADSQPHNIAIFPSEDKLDTALFKGAITSPGAKSTYEVGKLAAGTYFFHCDVHPTMTGKAVVKAAAAEG